MSLESFAYIKDLVPTNPLGSDPKSEGDDHLRGIKQTLQNQFPGFTQGKPITVTEDQINNSTMERIYPIGSIYFNVGDVDPATLLGVGTWTKIADGTFLMSSGATHAVGSTGGAATHTLTVDEMPNHSHVYTGEVHNQPGYNGIVGGGTAAQDRNTTATGGGAAHNNLPPYLAVNMWKRTA